MSLSNRLITIANFIHKDASVFDVGADHGLLEKYLLDNSLVRNIVAVENKEGPYKILKNSLKDYKATVLLSDGIEDLDDSCDTIVIAGMGGFAIVDILTKHVQKLNYISQIVVDAHKDVELVRREITKMGFRIERERIILENDKYYFIISFVKGNSAYKDIEMEFGYQISRDPLFQEFKTQEIKRLSLNLIKQKKAKIIKPDQIKKLELKIERLESLWIQ